MASGDLSWIMTATALVMLMTPSLGFFYGGLVRKKNLVSTIVQCLIIFAVISIIWAIIGCSLVFGPSVNGIIGDLSLVGLNNIGIHKVNLAMAPDIPELLFFAFQLKFAAITPAAGYVTVTSALIIGLAAGVISNLVANWRAGRSRINYTLDVFACNGIGGIWG